VSKHGAESALRGAESFALNSGSNQPRPVDSVPITAITTLLDGSPAAEKVLPQVLAMSKALRTPVLLVKTYSVPRGSHAFAKRFCVPYTDRVADDAKREANDYVSAKASELQKKGLETVSTALVRRDSAAEVVGLSLKTSGNMLALCIQKSSLIFRLAVSGVAERIVRHWPGPVLVVKSVVLAWSVPLWSLYDFAATFS
jgi:nucleotide-binding universal stress UspA family protein